MKMIPKVTRDLDEFYKLEGKERGKRPIEFWLNGVCGTYTIWYRNDVLSLIHEVSHYPFWRLHETSNNCSVILFCDFIEGITDFINGVLRYKEWRENVHYCFRTYIVATLKDWLDWMLCR